MNSTEQYSMKDLSEAEFISVQGINIKNNFLDYRVALLEDQKVLIVTFKNFIINTIFFDNKRKNLEEMDIDSSYFLPRLGYIINQQAKELSFVYKLNGRVMDFSDFTKAEAKFPETETYFYLEKVRDILQYLWVKDLNAGFLHPNVFVYCAFDERSVKMIDFCFLDFISNSALSMNNAFCGVFYRIHYKPIDELLFLVFAQTVFESLNDPKMLASKRYQQLINKLYIDFMRYDKDADFVSTFEATLEAIENTFIRAFFQDSFTKIKQRYLSPTDTPTDTPESFGFSYSDELEILKDDLTQFDCPECDEGRLTISLNSDELYCYGCNNFDSKKEDYVSIVNLPKTVSHAKEIIVKIRDSLSLNKKSEFRKNKVILRKSSFYSNLSKIEHYFERIKAIMSTHDFIINEVMTGFKGKMKEKIEKEKTHLNYLINNFVEMEVSLKDKSVKKKSMFISTNEVAFRTREIYDKLAEVNGLLNEMSSKAIEVNMLSDYSNLIQKLVINTEMKTNLVKTFSDISLQRIYDFIIIQLNSRVNYSYDYKLLFYNKLFSQSDFIIHPVGLNLHKTTLKTENAYHVDYYESKIKMEFDHYFKFISTTKEYEEIDRIYPEFNEKEEINQEGLELIDKLPDGCAVSQLGAGLLITGGAGEGNDLDGCYLMFPLIFMKSCFSSSGNEEDCVVYSERVQRKNSLNEMYAKPLIEEDEEILEGVFKSSCYVKTCMRNRRCYHSAVRHNGVFLIVVGGTGNKTCEQYNVLQDTWTELPELNFVREEPNLFIYEGDLYAVGGKSQGKTVNSVEKLNLTSKEKWEVVEVKMDFKFNLPIRCGIIQRKEDEVMLIGGRLVEDNEMVRTSLIFYVEANKIIENVELTLDQEQEFSTNYLKVPHSEAFWNIGVGPDGSFVNHSVTFDD